MASTLDKKPARRADRLPSTDHARRGRQVWLGVLSLLGGALIVVGVPIALLALFGTPWPDERPSLEWLTSPTTTETVLAVLAAVVWLAWLHFVICLIVEAVAAVRERGLAPPVPGGGFGTQALARNLVDSVTVLLGATTVAVGPASAAGVSDGHDLTAASAQSAPGQREAYAAEIAAAQRESDAETAREVDLAWTARDTSRLPAPAELEDATRRDLRAGVTAYYEVQPPHGRHYDTLWDMAERYLGDGLRYKEIWELNRGLKQPDGHVLENPDLIYPGWVMRLPGDADGPGLKAVDHAQPVQPDSGPPSGAGADADVVERAGQLVAEEAGGGPGDRVLDTAWSPLFGVAGGVALGGALLALRRRRAYWSMGQLWGAVGAGPPDPSPEDDGPGPGAGLRGEADPAMVTWMDGALRSSAIGTAHPAPARVSVGASGLAVAFDQAPDAVVPPGWEATGDRVWTLRRDHDTPAGEQPAPMPGLVAIGRRDDGSLLLVDPESVPGVVVLEGPEEIARGLAISMILDTATHPWADGRTVTMVGFADDLSRAGDGNIRHVAELARVLEGLENVARHQRAACQRAGVDTARAARMEGLGSWEYHLLVCSGVPSAEEFSRLQAIAQDPRVSLGAVVIGSLPGAGMRLSAQPDRRLTSPLHGIDVWAQTIEAPTARALADLYEAPPVRGVTFDEWASTIAAEGAGDGVTEARVRLGVLGPVTVEAPGTVVPERQGFLSELASFLALHPEGVHVNRIAGALWPRGVENGVRDAALRQLSEWFGSTADGAPVLVEDAGVWRLTPGAVDLDWDRFRAQVSAAAAEDPPSEGALTSVLHLVRGAPFESIPDGRYGWLESTTAEADMNLAIGLTCLAAGNAAARHRDAVAARVVLDRGIEVLPANQELWRARLRLESMFGERRDLIAVADAMYSSLGDGSRATGPSGETDALVDELLPGYRVAVA